MIVFKFHTMVDWFAVFLIMCAQGDEVDAFKRRCGVKDIGPNHTAKQTTPRRSFLVESPVMFKQDQGIEVNRASFNSGEGECKEQYIIHIAWHVIFDSQGLGNVSETALQEQVKVLNEAFADSPFRFATRSVDRTRNDAWFNNCLSKWYYIRNTLGISPATTLNMYTCRFANPDMIGDATPPWFFGENEKSHGVAILFETLPGGGLVTLNLGDNAVHEIGHYFGLFHVCQGECYREADDVADTPRCAYYTYYCTNDTVDTCPTQSGLDPIHNYMGYMEDACMSEFTPGQIEKMKNDVGRYRPSLLKNVYRPCHIDSAFRWSNGYIYLFLGSSYFRYNETRHGIDPGYPVPIDHHWRNVPSAIDGVFRYANGLTYFFKGNQYYRFNDTSQSVDPGYPRLISGFWKGAPNDIDDVINYYNRYTYFFKGRHYYRYNPSTRSVDPGYPRLMNSYWKGVPSDIEGALPWYNGGVYFFKNKKYWLFLHGDDTVEVSVNYPKSMTLWWKSEPEIRGYTVLRHRDGHTYFFKSSYYWRYNDQFQQVDVGYPRSLVAWGAVPADVDAAFLWSDGNTYFFKGTKYFRYNINREIVDDGYPREIRSFWKGVPDNVDAVFRYVNDITYFFKGQYYFRLNDTTHSVEPGYPQPIVSFWKGIPSNIDTVFTTFSGQTFFFKGNLFYRFNGTSGCVDPGYPKTLALWRGILYQP